MFRPLLPPPPLPPPSFPLPLSPPPPALPCAVELDCDDLPGPRPCLAGFAALPQPAAGEADSHQRKRRRKNARERRQQLQRSVARHVQWTAKILLSLQHRGSQPTAVGTVLLRYCQNRKTKAPHRGTDQDPTFTTITSPLAGTGHSDFGPEEPDIVSHDPGVVGFQTSDPHGRINLSNGPPGPSSFSFNAWAPDFTPSPWNVRQESTGDPLPPENNWVDMTGPMAFILSSQDISKAETDMHDVDHYTDSGIDLDIGSEDDRLRIFLDRECASSSGIPQAPQEPQATQEPQAPQAPSDPSTKSPTRAGAQLSHLSWVREQVRSTLRVRHDMPTTPEVEEPEPPTAESQQQQTQEITEFQEIVQDRSNEDTPVAYMDGAPPGQTPTDAGDRQEYPVMEVDPSNLIGTPSLGISHDPAGISVRQDASSSAYTKEHCVQQQETQGISAGPEISQDRPTEDAATASVDGALPSQAPTDASDRQDYPVTAASDMEVDPPSPTGASSSMNLEQASPPDSYTTFPESRYLPYEVWSCDECLRSDIRTSHAQCPRCGAPRPTTPPAFLHPQVADDAVIEAPPQSTPQGRGKKKKRRKRKSTTEPEAPDTSHSRAGSQWTVALPPWFGQHWSPVVLFSYFWKYFKWSLTQNGESRAQFRAELYFSHVGNFDLPLYADAPLLPPLPRAIYEASWIASVQMDDEEDEP